MSSAGSKLAFADFESSKYPAWARSSFHSNLAMADKASAWQVTEPDADEMFDKVERRERRN